MRKQISHIIFFSPLLISMLSSKKFDKTNTQGCLYRSDNNIERDRLIVYVLRTIWSNRYLFYSAVGTEAITKKDTTSGFVS